MIIFSPYVISQKIQLQPTSYQSQSLKAFIQNSFYKTVIDIYVEFCSRIWFENTSKKFKIGTVSVEIHEFFKQLIKLYFVIGEASLKISENGEVELLVQPEDTDIQKIVNVEIPFIAEAFPPLFHVIEFCERLKNIVNSFLTKQHILLNFVGCQKSEKVQEVLKLDPNFDFQQNLETLFELQTQTINQLRNVKVKEGTFISTIPGFEIDILKNDVYLKYQDIVVPLIEQLSALSRIPSFLLSGNLERINYAASRAALSDFVVHTNSLTQTLADKFIDIIQESIDYTLPLPLMHSGNELANLLKILENYVDKSKLLKQLILSGIVS